VDLKLGHHAKDGIEVIDVQGEIDMYTAPRLRELLIDLIGKGSYQLVVNLDKVGFCRITPGGRGDTCLTYRQARFIRRTSPVGQSAPPRRPRSPYSRGQTK
jgi:hypothetical protein